MAELTILWVMDSAHGWQEERVCAKYTVQVSSESSIPGWVKSTALRAMCVYELVKYHGRRRSQPASSADRNALLRAHPPGNGHYRKVPELASRLRKVFQALLVCFGGAF